jgi:hypothetical protein
MGTNMIKNERTNTLRAIFEKYKVLNMNEIYKALQSTSRATVFRYLHDLNHLTSYTHNGKYYTLPEIVQFDEEGFWHFGDIGFSSRGTLMNTLVHIITMSESGKTNSELEKYFRIRVQNSLQKLLKPNRIAMAKPAKSILYISPDTTIGNQQIKRRTEVGYRKRLPDWITAEILVETIKLAPVQPGIDDVANSLIKRGSLITREQVKQVFEENDLEKKTLD